MKQSHLYPAGTSVVMLVLTLAACRDTYPVDPIFDQPRIVPGISIDGVMLGEYPEAVEQKIGKAQEFGSGEGPKAPIIHSYTQGNHKGLMIFYVSGYVADTLVCGPADYIQVDTTYEGKTKEGIGTGSTVASVLTTWGRPSVADSSHLPLWLTFTFYIQGKRFNVDFENGKIRHMSIGPFIEDPQREFRLSKGVGVVRSR